MQVSISCASPADATRPVAEGLWTHLESYLGGAPDLLFLGVPPGHDLKALAHDLNQHAPWARLMGVTFPQQPAGHPITLMGIRDPGGAFGLAGGPTGADVRGTTRALTDQALADARRVGEQPHLVWVWSLPAHQEEALKGVRDLVGPGVPVVCSPIDPGPEGRLMMGQRLWAEGIVVSTWFWTRLPRQIGALVPPPEPLMPVLQALGAQRQAEVAQGDVAVLEAAAHLVGTPLGSQLDQCLLDQCARLTGADGCALLISDAQGRLFTKASTHPSLNDRLWSPGDLFTRVLNGEAVSLFDIRRVDEWRGGSITPGVRSALHAPLRPVQAGEASPGMVVCVHTTRGIFTPQLRNQLAHLVKLYPASAETPASDGCCALAQGAPALLWAVDAELRLVEFNVAFAQEARALLDIEPVVGATLNDELSALYAQLDTTRPLRTMQTRTVNGQIRHLELTLQGMADDLVVGCAYDITERTQAVDVLKDARDRAQQASASKSDYLAVMTHEIRTPLNAMLGMVDLTMATPLSKEQREYIDSMKSNAEVLSSLINDILDISKIEAGQMQLAHADLDPGELVELVVQSLAERAEDKRLLLRCEIDPRLPFKVTGDPQRFRQIVLNLVSNAIKYTDHGEVKVSLALAEGRHDMVNLRLTVSDTGQGIAEAEQKRIFERFYQGTAGHQRSGGTGLGLTITHTLVNLMGGHITLDSAPGQGARFTVDLRVPVHTWRNDELAHLKAQLEGVRVLLVERDAIITPLFEAHLPKTAFSAATDLTSARSMLESQRWDALILDTTFPAVAQVAAQSRDLWPDRPTLLMTPINTPSASWATDLPRLPRPLQRKRLIEVLSQTLSGKGAHTGRAMPLPRAVRRVLLVEDNPDSQVVVSRILSRAGHMVEVADTAQRAIKSALTNTFDLILMDVHLPGMDGIEATRIIKERSMAMGRPDVPIVALTAHATAQFRQACLEAGMDSFTVKPIKRQALLALVEQARWPREAMVLTTTPTPQTVVQVDPDIADLVPRFLAARHQDLDTISDALSRGDYDRIRVLGHQMKGTGGAYGFPRISELGRRLEQGAKAGHAQTIIESADALRRYLDSVKIEHG
ncbi:MAG: ATP-binding protein [Bradymonadia bacterium]